MHHRDPVQGLKRRQPPNTKNERSLRQRTALLLAIVIVNSTPPGTSVLDRMGQIIQDREQQQEQQRCTDATKSQQATTFPQQDEDVEGVDKGGGGGAGRRNDFSPDRTRSPSPRLAEKRQQQQQQTQQLGFGGSIAGGRDQAWKLREKLLEMEIDTLRRWKLNRQLEEDRARLRNLEAADSCICRGGLQKVAKRRRTISTPHLATSESSACEGSGQEDSTELVECKHRLLGHLDVIRRNQYFLEQAIASSEKQTIGREEVPTSLWNLSMTTNLILAVKEVTAMLCSPMIRFNLSERAYIHTMDAVQEYLREPFLTSGQYKNVLQVLETSWGQLLLPILSTSTELYAETSIPPSSSFPIARFGVAAQHQILQQQRHSGSIGEPHQSRCLGGLLCILLRALVQTLDAILRLNTSPQQQVEQQQRQNQPSGVGGDGGAYHFARKTRLTGKTQAAERVEQIRKSLASRQVTEQRQQQQEERCGQMVEIACGLLSAYRQSSLFMTERLERRQERFPSGNSDSGAMDEPQDSADSDSSSICFSSVDVNELKRVEDDCNRLMSSICSIALFSPDVSTTTTTERPPRHGVSVWLTTRIQRLVSIDCFQ